MSRSVAMAIALAMVGAPFLEPGIGASAPSKTSSSSASSAAVTGPDETLAALATAGDRATGLVVSDPRFPLSRVVRLEQGLIVVSGSLTTPASSDAAALSAAMSAPSARRSGAAVGSQAVPDGHPLRLVGRRTWRIAPKVTWYGPGFYGRQTACGQRYTRHIKGVAHRSLPCGTLVRFRWGGITAVAPVIDRGPFAPRAYVFDWSAWMACRVFRPRGEDNSCYTRTNVRYQVVGRVNLKRWFERKERWD